MKRFVVSLIITLIGILMLASVLTGCDDSSGSDFDPPEYVYVPDVLPFSMPEGVEWIENITVSGDTIFFTAYGEQDESTPYGYADIYSMNLNDSSIKKLPNYSTAVEFPADAEEGNIQIYSMCVDSDGNIWIAERGEFFRFPDHIDEDDWERWFQRIMLNEFTRVRKLDNTGSELLSIDVSKISAGQDWFYISAFIVDDENNVYIGSDSSIHVFDSNGNALFTLDPQWVEDLVKMQDGSIAHTGWGGSGRVLSKIDVASKKFGETIDLPSNAYNVYPGNDEYPVIFSDNTGLHGINAESGEVTLLLNWIDSDMTLDGLGSISLLPDGRILVTSQQWGSEGVKYEIVFLVKTPYSDLPEKTVLTLATFYLDWNIRSAIVQFNRTSETHRIQVTDYSEFNTDDDWQAGITRLSAEIIAGNVPDLLDVSNLPYNQYAAKGLLMDLYPLIDADPDLDRSDFMESALRATEINGGLYKVFPSFSVVTMLGHPSVVGSYPGWNMEEFVSVLKAHPEADYPLGQGLTKLNLLQALFMFGMDDYVDWDKGTVNFESNNFIALLEFANTLPDDYDWDDYIPSHELIATGRQIITATNINFLDELQMNRAMYGGDVVFKGLPAENRNGFSLTTNTAFSITNKCKDVDAAWDFLRIFLKEEWQRENIWYGVPLNKNVFDKLISEAMDKERGGASSIDGFLVEMEPLTQEDVDQIMHVINSVSGTVGQDDALWNIISESAADFFNGSSTAQNAARIIQNRASTYISERS